MLYLVVLIAVASKCASQMGTTGNPQVKIIEPKEGAQIPAGKSGVDFGRQFSDACVGQRNRGAMCELTVYVMKGEHVIWSWKEL